MTRSDPSETSATPTSRPSRVTITIQEAKRRRAAFLTGTCEAQSFGYGLGSYTAARLPDGGIKWDPADLANAVSSAFLYAVAVSDRLAGPCPGGGLALQYLQRLIAAGAPNRAQVPYEPNCTFLNNVDPSREWPNEDRFRIGGYSTFKLSPDSLELIKRLLAAGNAVAFTGRVYENYDDPPLDHGVFGSNTNMQPDTIPNSGHGQLLVGYDDTKGDPSAPGAFLIQNSFGAQWPPSEANADGRIWWAYRTFFDSQKLAATAYPRAESIPEQGKLESTLVQPEGFVTGVHHWVDPRDPRNVYLIVELQFMEPVQLESITITEPTTGTQVQQEYGLPFSTGYVFTRRIDGAQFVHGGWTVGITVEVGDVVGEYMGTIDVGQSVPTAPPPAPAAAPMFGTTGIEAAVLTGWGRRTPRTLRAIVVSSSTYASPQLLQTLCSGRATRDRRHLPHRLRTGDGSGTARVTGLPQRRSAFAHSKGSMGPSRKRSAGRWAWTRTRARPRRRTWRSAARSMWIDRSQALWRRSSVRRPDEPDRCGLLHMEQYPNEGALRGGHIPGAKNVPWSRAVDAETHTFEPGDQLRSLYIEGQGLRPDEPTIS